MWYYVIIYVNHIFQTCPFWSGNASVYLYRWRRWRLTLCCHQNLGCKNCEGCGLNRPRIASFLCWKYLNIGINPSKFGEYEIDFEESIHPFDTLTLHSRFKILEIRTEEDIISKTTVQASSANTGPLQHCRSSMIVHGWVDGPPINKVWKSTKIEKSKDGKCRVRTQVWNHQPPAMYLCRNHPIYVHFVPSNNISSHRHHTTIMSWYAMILLLLSSSTCHRYIPTFISKHSLNIICTHIRMVN